MRLYKYYFKYSNNKNKPLKAPFKILKNIKTLNV